LAFVVLFLTYFLTTVVIYLSYGSNRIVKYFETRPQVIAFLKKEAKETEINGLFERLSGDVRVRDVRYVGREEAKKIYEGRTQDNPSLSQLVSPSIFPESIEFSLYNLKTAHELLGEVRGENIVENVGFTASLGGDENIEMAVDRLNRASLYVKLVGLFTISVFGLVSLITLISLIGLKVVSRKEELDLMLLMGAKRISVKVPVWYEALVYNFFSGIFGFLTATTLLLYSAPHLVNYFGGYEIFPIDLFGLFSLVGITLAVNLLLGTFISFLAGNLAVNRLTRKR
jgi:cell division protein FtsX